MDVPVETEEGLKGLEREELAKFTLGECTPR
jgi:hypothetical protein